MFSVITCSSLCCCMLLIFLLCLGLMTCLILYKEGVMSRFMSDLWWGGCKGTNLQLLLSLITSIESGDGLSIFIYVSGLSLF